MNQHSASAQIERIVRNIFETLTAGEGEHEHNLERYVAPMLTLFDDEGKTLTLREAIYRADMWSDICQDISTYLREARDASSSTGRNTMVE